MRKIKFLSLGTLLVLASISCKKKTNDCNGCVVEAPPPPPGLTFVLNGSNTVITADSAWFVPLSRTIVAYYQGTSHKLFIKTSAQTVGTYSISIANTLTYTENVLVYIATGGSIAITSANTAKISGEFLTLGNSGGFTSVKGNFVDLPKR